MEQKAKTLYVLVAEDDAQTRLSLDVTLRRAGHQTLLMESGDALLAAVDCMSEAECRRIDLLVTDINMPGTQGDELIEALDARGLCLPVVVITAYEVPALEAAFSRRGAVRMLRKPFRPEALTEAVAETYADFQMSGRGGAESKTVKGGVCQ